MQPGQAGFEQIKQGMRATWMAGDFGQIAQHSVKAAEEFVRRVGISAANAVLDIACGTGNIAIPAARAGAKVIGVDIAPNLLEQARKRAANEALDVHFEKGDAESLPYGDGRFDVVMTMFGAMFAPRPHLVASEMLRVCKSGGTVAMANWTNGGFVEKMFAVGSRFLPPPAGVPSPLLWGDEATVKERLGSGATEVKTTRIPFEMRFTFPPAEVVQLFRKYFGPVHMTFSRLDAQGQKEFIAELEKLWSEHNEATDDTTLIRSEYLQVVARRA
jgi:SAM-dependent methyltransferase